MEIKLHEKLSGSVLLPEDIGQRGILHGGVAHCPDHPFSLTGWKPPVPTGDIRIFTAGDLADRNTLIYPDGEIPILADRQTFWPGQPAVLVCSSDRNLLTKYLENCEETFRSDKTVKSPFLKTEKSFCTRTVQTGNPENVFRKREQVFEEIIEIPSSKFLSSQPWSAYCRKDGDLFTVHTASQWPHSIQLNGSRLLGIRKDRILVENHPADYINQNRIFMPTLFACFSLILSSRTGQSVILTPGIEGNRRSTSPSGDFRFHFRMTLKDDSDIEALSIDIKYSAGAFPLFCQETLDRVCYTLKNLYRIPHLMIKSRAVQTQAPPSDGGPGFGTSAAFLALDLFLGSLRDHIPECPLKWRQKQTSPVSVVTNEKPVRKQDNPFAPVLGQVADMSGFARKTGACEQANRTRVSGSPAEHPLRGIGLAAGFSGSNFIRKWPELTGMSASLLLDKEGKLFIKPSNIPCHTELFELWRKMAAATLSLPRENVHFLQDPFSGTGILSRNVTMMTDLIVKGLSSIQNRRFRQPLPIEITKTISGKDTQKFDPETFEGDPYFSLSRSAAVVEIVMHRGEDLPEINKIWLCASCGSLLDIEIARSILEAEISLAVAWCRYRVVDGYGISRLMKAGKPPVIDIQFLAEKAAPGGIEGLAFASVPAAYMQAVNQTLERPLLSIPFCSSDIRKGLYHAD